MTTVVLPSVLATGGVPTSRQQVLLIDPDTCCQVALGFLHSVARCRQCIRCYKVTFTDNCFLLLDSFLIEIIQIINDDVILPGSSGRKLSSMTINVRISHVVSSSLSLKLFITFRRKLYGRKKIVS